jgi:hypothetical protein
MRKKTRTKVVHTIERELTRVLRNSSADYDLLGIEDERPAEDWRSGSFELFLSTDLRSELEDTLKKRPEPTSEQLDKFLQEMKTIDADSLLRPTLKHLARRLPPFPPGKPPKLDSEQQKRALTELAGVSLRGALSRKAAYRKVAKKYGVHWRTIQNLSTKTFKQPQKGAKS